MGAPVRVRVARADVQRRELEFVGSRMTGHPGGNIFVIRRRAVHALSSVG